MKGAVMADEEFVTRREFDMAREYERQLREADQRAIAIKQDADDRAKILQQGTDRDYRASSNEWRGESGDRAATYVTRAEMKPLQDYVMSQQGRSAGISALQVLLFSLAGLAIAALGVALAIAR